MPKTKEEHDARADAERKRRKNAHRVRYPYQDLTAPFRGWLFADHAPRNRPRDLHHPLKAKQDDRIEDGLTPAMIKKHYNFPDSQDCSGQTIAMMAVGVENSHASLARDMEEFWVASASRGKLQDSSGSARPRCTSRRATFTASKPVWVPSWIGALAPQAQIIIYDMATDLPDPWLAAVEMAIADQRTAPTVICMTWDRPRGGVLPAVQSLRDGICVGQGRGFGHHRDRRVGGLGRVRRTPPEQPSRMNRGPR